MNARAAETPTHVVDASMFWGPAGGVRRMLAAKHERLPAHGFRHSVAAPDLHGDGHIDCGGVALPASGGYRFVLSRRQAAAAIASAQPDLIESADPYRMAWACLDVARQRAIPTLAFCHSNLPLVAGRHFGAGAERWAQRYLQRLYEQFDLVLAPSRCVVQALRGWGLERVQRQPLGVDCALFHPARRDLRWRHALLQRLQRRSDTRLLVYAGRFAAEKNLGLMTEAMAQLGPRYLLLLVGSGPRTPHGDNLQVLGLEHDAMALARVLASCDAFVHAGDQETFGLAALEAMACGTRVVVSAEQGLGELAGGVGLTVDSRRAQLWAEAMAEAADNAAPAQTDAALARAREHDWSHIVAQMAWRYEGLVRRASRARLRRREERAAAAAPAP